LASLRIVFAASAAACALSGPVCAWAAPAERLARVEGVDDRTLKAAIERAVGDQRTPPDNRLEARSRARDAAENAEALLRSEGYYASVITPDIGEGDQPTAFIKVTPGPRFVFADPKIDWLAPEPSVEAKAASTEALDLVPGAPGRAADVLDAEGRAVAALQIYGHADAVAQPRQVVVDHADHSVRPTFRIAAGAPVRLGAIRLEAAGRTRRGWVNHLAPWNSGDLYTPNAVAELERRLLDAQVFDQVTVALAPAADVDAQGLRPVVVGLADRRPRSLEVSAGYSTTEGADGDVRLSFFNRLGRADTLALETRYGELGGRVGVDLSLPHWRTPGRTLKLTAEVFRDTTDAYDQFGQAIRADLTHRYGRTTYFTRGLSLVKSHVNDKHNDPGALDLVAVKGLVALALDKSDDPLNPTRGWRAEARVEPTLVTGENSLIYARSQAQISAYLPFDSDGDTVLAGRLKLGSIVGGSYSSVPAFDRFYAGGGGSVRGYGYQSVGPKYSDGDPQGGLSLFEASAEIRHNFTQTIGAVAFVDAGSVGQAVNPNFGSVRYAVGLGLRYNLAFAPIRVDVATPLQRVKGEGAFQLYVSIGQAF
jgi:translocation and assembly module TamA